uniref:MarR family winged helix-turn-helix transcriptional regulator n=1 Tax=Paractinoplanes polyasparticus TaxID=2856853 RepID=UPI001C84FC0E|nr:MarR family winged helix-turn-helix transcriptional regulator [Actinoplanes polyasparticus]
MPDIWALMRAIRRSGLPAPERHTLLTLATLIDPATGLIPERFMPSLTDLAGFTGLGRSTVVRALNSAENGGWIKRTVPPKHASQKNKERTSYLLVIPANAPADDPEEPERASATAGLVPERDQLEGWSQSGTSATAGLGLVPERDQASATAGHKELNHVYQGEPPPPTEEGPRDETVDPDALFSVPNQREPGCQTQTITEEPAKKAAPKRKRLSRTVTKNPETLPVDWSVSPEMEAWAKEKTRDVICRIATERFITYFGDGKRKKDWDLTWRNWLLRDQQDIEQRAKASNGSGYNSNASGRRNHNSNPGQYRNADDDSAYDDWSAVTR